MATTHPRRRAWIVAGSLLLLGAAAAGAWHLWLPEQRPPLREGERYGIDVSHHQGEVDWEAVAGDGIEFAYLKATEGEDHVDRELARSWEAAGQAGVDRGAYHFFTLCTPGDAQADHFLRTAPAGAELPPALDLELAGNCSERPGEEDVRRQVDIWVAAVEEATGSDVVLYVGQDFADEYGARPSWEGPHWIPRFWRRPDEPWVAWQVTFGAHVDGVDGGVDLDVGRGPLG